jgi:hypothetical protein
MSVLRVYFVPLRSTVPTYCPTVMLPVSTDGDDLPFEER